jgi:ribosome maturation factor RimP
MSKIIDKINELAKPIVEKNECELWNIEYVKEAGTRYLRVFIDKPDGGVSINHCEAVSKELDPLLDELEYLIPDSYTFEVSSAGVERHLRGPQDFDRFKGQFVEIKCYKGKVLSNTKDAKKIFQGLLKGWDKNTIILEIENTDHTFETTEVATIRLRLI